MSALTRIRKTFLPIPFSRALPPLLALLPSFSPTFRHLHSFVHSPSTLLTDSSLSYLTDSPAATERLWSAGTVGGFAEY
eukprot:759394-Hanusia_phi.AAC.9